MPEVAVFELYLLMFGFESIVIFRQLIEADKIIITEKT